MGLMIGPFGHFWYTKLADKLVLGTGPKVVLKKIGVDQIIFTPFITCLFFGGKNNGLFLCNEHILNNITKTTNSVIFFITCRCA